MVQLPGHHQRDRLAELFRAPCPQSEPNFQVLAYNMLDALLHSTTRRVEWGEWHLPFGDKITGLDFPTAWKVITARCARTSYLTFDGLFSVEKDVALHDQLVRNGHMSPLEHAAQAVKGIARNSNFGRGWLQYRKTIPNENRENVDLWEILAGKPDWVPINRQGLVV